MMIGVAKAIGMAMTVMAAATPAVAKDVIVNMKDVGVGGTMVFEPMFVRAMPGDTIRFMPISSGHNAELIPAILPAGVTPTKGAMSKEFDLTVSAPGLYGVKCMPHYSLGMIALIQVGKGTPPNLAEAKAAKLPPFAARRMTPMLAAIK